MEYRIARLIGQGAQEGGWEEIRSLNRICLKNSREIIEIEFNREKITIKIEGEGNVLLKRGNIIARLRNGNTGQAREGDEIWLMNKKAEEEYKLGERDNFEGAAIKLQIVNNKKDIFIKEKSQSQEKRNKTINLIMGLVVL